MVEPSEEVEEQDATNAAEITADTRNGHSDSASTEEETDKAEMITRNALAAWLDFDEHDMDAPEFE